VITESVHYDDSGAPQLLAPELDQALERARAGQGFVLLAVVDPGADEIEAIQERFGLPALAVEDAQEGHQRPKLERYGDEFFLVVKTVRYEEGRAAIDVGEVDLFIGEHYAIVAGHRQATVIEGARRRLDEDPASAAAGAMAAAWAILDEVVDGYEPVIDKFADDLERLEEAVFEKGRDQGQAIYLHRQQVARMARVVHPMLGLFDRLDQGQQPDLAERLRPPFRDVGDHVQRLFEEVDLLGNALDGLQNANVSGVTVRQNIVLQKVSGWAAIVAVPTVITGIYGMNFEHMPELGWRFGYPLALVGMLVVVVVLYWRFKRTGWM
jgi:magnesium transporter